MNTHDLERLSRIRSALTPWLDTVTQLSTAVGHPALSQESFRLLSALADFGLALDRTIREGRESL
jgi:hypothetical protein